MRTQPMSCSIHNSLRHFLPTKTSNNEDKWTLVAISSKPEIRTNYQILCYGTIRIGGDILCKQEHELATCNFATRC